MSLKHGSGPGHVYDTDLTSNIQLPLPPLNIQQEIIKKIESIENKEKSIERD